MNNRSMFPRNRSNQLLQNSDYSKLLHAPRQFTPLTIQGPLKAYSDHYRGDLEIGFQILNVAVVNQSELGKLPLG